MDPKNRRIGPIRLGTIDVGDECSKCTVCVSDNYMLVTVLPTPCWRFWSSSSGINIQKMSIASKFSHQYYQIVTKFKSLTSRCHQHHCHPKIELRKNVLILKSIDWSLNVHKRARSLWSIFQGLKNTLNFMTVSLVSPWSPDFLIISVAVLVLCKKCSISWYKISVVGFSISSFSWFSLESQSEFEVHPPMRTTMLCFT